MRMFRVILFLAVCGALASSCSVQRDTPKVSAEKREEVRPAPLLGGTGTAPQWKGAAPSQAGAFRFVVLGDRTGGHIPGEWEAAVAEANLLKPDLVLCVGDLIEGYSTNVVALNRMWDEFDSLTAKLDAPFYMVAGNHDIGNEVMRREWLRRYGVDGRSYYSFDFRNCHFVVLDTPTALFSPDFMAGQLEWLKSDLEAAAGAEHVFIFYHHPQPDGGEAWVKLAGMLNAGRTTVFNGHWHALSYTVSAGIPVYVLSASAAGVGGGQRELGELRMLAHVAVDRGQPTVAVLPLHEVLPGDFIRREFVDAFKVAVQGGAPTSIPASGGVVSLSWSNRLAWPMSVRVEWTNRAWRVTPPAAAVSLRPGEAVSLPFDVRPDGSGGGRAVASVTVTATNPAGREVSVTRSQPVALYESMDIPAISGIRVDGRADEWGVVRGLALAEPRYVWDGAASWKGAKDFSARFMAAHDTNRLYVCVQVTDDLVCTDAAETWNNDAVELYWDARPASAQNGLHGPGTGQVIVPVPKQGVTPTLQWEMGGRPAPSNLVAAVARCDGGYVCEMSVPLDELRGAPAVAGATINLEVQINDRDVERGAGTVSRMNTSGADSSYRVTRHYARCMFR